MMTLFLNISRNVKRLILLSILSLLLQACGGGGSSDSTVTPPPPPANVAPTANAGDDQTVDEETSVTLSGSGQDSDGSISSYAWTHTSGDSVTLNGSDTTTASFSAPTTTSVLTMTFQLTVTDNDGASGSDTVNIVINPVNTPPTVDAGSDQTVNEGDNVVLAAIGSDSDGNIALYEWQQTSGTSVTLANHTNAQSSFTAPDVNVSEDLVFSVTVTDNEGATASDTVTITVLPVNVPPIIDAGSDQTVDEEVDVQLTATASDSDGTIASYLWVQTQGASVTLNNATSAISSFTAPTLTEQATLSFRVTVTDDSGDTAEDSLTITVNPVNALPTADAGIDQAVLELATVNLEGSGSSDSDGSITGYSWLQTQGTTVSLSSSSSATPSFTAPDITVEETLIFELTVTDNEGGEASDTVSITIQIDNPPTADISSDLFANSGDLVTLDGSGSTDTEGNLSYSWLQTDTTGVNISLSEPFEESPTFTAPVVTAAITITVELTVTDTGNQTDTISIDIAIIPVIASVMNDTGYVDCADYAFDTGSGLSNNNESCSDTTDSNGDPIPHGQDGDYGRDVSANDDSDGKAGFSFTKIDGEGKPLPQDATSWTCVRDNTTGLLWEVKATDGSFRDTANTYTWYDSSGLNGTFGQGIGESNGGACTDAGNCDTEKYADRVNASFGGTGLCGATDWDLPTPTQYRSIIDYGQPDPEISYDLNYFPNIALNDAFWVNQTYSFNRRHALYFDRKGGLNSTFKDRSYKVRLVSLSQQNLLNKPPVITVHPSNIGCTNGDTIADVVVASGIEATDFNGDAVTYTPSVSNSYNCVNTGGPFDSIPIENFSIGVSDGTDSVTSVTRTIKICPSGSTYNPNGDACN